jgi:hypothetical protein
MPIRKLRLSRADQAKYLDRLKKLRAEGLDFEIPEEWVENSRALDIVLAGPAENTVIETPSHGVVYAVRIRGVAQRSGSIVTEWDLCTDYDDQIVPESFNDRETVYRPGGQEYRRCDVLNQRIENGMRLSRGQIVEGWLLATGLRRVPMEYGNTVSLELVLRDQFGHEITAECKASVLRRTQSHRPGVRRGTGLDGWSAYPTPAGPSIEEESWLRYREMVAREKIAKSEPPASVDEQPYAPQSDAEREEEVMRIAQWLNAIANQRE